MSHTKTALVTGASEGIGHAFCKVLAAQGYALVLVARREARLQQVADELSRDFNVTCHAIACDLSEPQAAQKLFRKTKDRGLVIDFLVNNAGLLFNGSFADLDLSGQENLLQVNVVALTSLTHLFANDMAGRKRGHILNVASTAAWVALPNENVYAASKAYVLSFTQALVDEMDAKRSGVKVTALCPSFTDTKMLDNPDQGAKLKIPRFMMLSPDFVARKGINACLKGKPVCTPGVSSVILMYVVQLFPKMWVARVMGKVYRRFMS